MVIALYCFVGLLAANLVAALLRAAVRRVRARRTEPQAEPVKPEKLIQYAALGAAAALAYRLWQQRREQE